MDSPSLKFLHKSLLTHVPYNYDKDSTLLLDLVTIMGSIYCFDIATGGRGENSRDISITIPVYNIEIWEECIEEIILISEWVSEDNFHINLENNNYYPKEDTYSLLMPNNHYVTLFSGGLDSLAGAYHNFNNSIKSDYIGFINKGEEKTKQLLISDFYNDTFDDNTEVHLIEKPNVTKKHYTQSTRSLLYIALAVTKAYFNGSNKVFLYENGILSLNPEISNRFTTKTTHPKTIYLYNKILSKIGVNIDVNHPFIFQTKGEIINNMNIDFKNQIKDTFTCGQSRTHPSRNHVGQCGICIPCLLRKISIAAYDNEQFDCDYHYNYEIKFKDISEEVYRNDYISNIQYFSKYHSLIKNKEIHLEIDTHKEYYQEKDDYYKNNKLMFEKFSFEFERFMEKYDPN